jgi:tRNA A58 N-methylase Trm61
MHLFNFLYPRRSPIDWFANDKKFNRLYPPHIASLSRPHWTPVAVARAATPFLAESGKKVLDVGSGVGKFCLVAGALRKNTSFYGVEQRLNLVHFAKDAQEKLKLDNVHFTHGNVTETDFSNYDHFYFYNAFYEQLSHVDKIDFDIPFSQQQFDQYTHHLYNELSKLRGGTKLVTYHAQREQIPNSYGLVRREFDMRLEFWIKK